MNKFLLLVGIFISMNVVAQDSLNMEVLYNWFDDDLPASFGHNNTYNEIWGYTDGTLEYAIIGTTMGTHIFDVTNPESATLLHFIEGAFTGGNVVHRDYHDYQGYLYIVCDEGASTLQIVDLSNLPGSIDIVYDSSDLFTRSHNIFIDEAKGILYVCGGSSQLDLYDLEDPTSPEFLIDCDEDVSGWEASAGYIHDIYVEDGIAFCNAGGDGLYIVDFNDVNNVQFLGSLTDYPESGYNHSGWLHEDGDIYALADETHGTRIKILDVSDPTDIEVLSFIGTDIDDNSIPHNLIFKGDYLHVSYYFDGYYIFDVSDPENPVVSAFYDTSVVPHSSGYKGLWGIYPYLPSGNLLASDMQEGLFVLSDDGPNNLSETEEASPVMVYPNPLIDGQALYIQGLNNVEQDVRISITNNVGVLVYSKQVQINNSVLEIQVPELASGVYLMTLSNSDWSSTSKLVK